jgi:hypothetical protein
MAKAGTIARYVLGGLLAALWFAVSTRTAKAASAEADVESLGTSNTSSSIARMRSFSIGYRREETTVAAVPRDIADNVLGPMNAHHRGL